MTLGERLRLARERAGMTGVAAAAALGIQRQTLSKWEADETVPTVDAVAELAELYDVSAGWLADEEGSPKRRESPDATEKRLELIRRLADPDAADEMLDRALRLWDEAGGAGVPPDV